MAPWASQTRAARCHRMQASRRTSRQQDVGLGGGPMPGHRSLATFGVASRSLFVQYIHAYRQSSKHTRNGQTQANSACPPPPLRRTSVCPGGVTNATKIMQRQRTIVRPPTSALTISGWRASMRGDSSAPPGQHSTHKRHCRRTQHSQTKLRRTRPTPHDTTTSDRARMRAC